jgi:hypothetical protein
MLRILLFISVPDIISEGIVIDIPWNILDYHVIMAERDVGESPGMHACPQCKPRKNQGYAVCLIGCTH